jgi:CRP/FNR family transcriptional regulator, cyclic AMP receptor protein
MAIQDLERVLSSHPFFSDMRVSHLQLLVSCASNARFDAGQFILREGQRANEFYLIRQGKVALEVYAPGRGIVNIQTLGESDVLGSTWLVPPYLWRFDARALENTLTIALNAECLRKKCESDFELGFEMLQRFNRVIVERLESAQFRLRDFCAA